MDITAEYIVRDCPHSAISVFNNPKEKLAGISPVTRLSAGKKIRSDYCYYGDDKEISLTAESHGNFIIYAEGGPLIRSVPAGCNCIFISDREDYEKYIDRLTEIFADEVRLGAVSAAMAHIVQTSQNLQDLLNYGFELLKNPILVSDASFNYIASAGTGSIQREPVWDYAIQHKTFPDNYISRLLGFFYEERVDAKFRLLMVDSANSNGLSHTQYSATMVQNNHILGYVKLLDYYDPPTEFDTRVLQLMAIYAVGLLDDTNLASYNHSINENFLEAILRRRITEPEEIRRKQVLLNIRVYDNIRVCTVIPESNLLSSEQLYYIHKELKTQFIGSPVVLINNHFVILLDCRENSEICMYFPENFEHFLRDNACTANVSLSFHQFEEVYQYYEQTLFCNEMRSLLMTDKTIVDYSEVYHFHMIAYFGKLVDLRQLIHPSIRTLMEEDAENGSNLVTTLICYLDSRENIATAAKTMNIHYNTMKNRVARILELTHLDLERGDTRFQLTLSSYILKLAERENEFKNEKEQ